MPRISYFIHRSATHLFWSVFCHCRQAIGTHHQKCAEHHILYIDKTTYLFWSVYCHCRWAICTHHQKCTYHHILYIDQLPTFLICLLPLQTSHSYTSSEMHRTYFIHRSATFLFWSVYCRSRWAIHTHHQKCIEHHTLYIDQLPTYSDLFIATVDETVHIIRYTQIILHTQISYLSILIWTPEYSRYGFWWTSIYYHKLHFCQLSRTSYCP